VPEMRRARESGLKEGEETTFFPPAISPGCDMWSAEENMRKAGKIEGQIIQNIFCLGEGTT